MDALFATAGEGAPDARAAELTRPASQDENQTALLSAVAEALKRLLTTDDFDLAMAEALRTLGEAAAMDRVKVFLRGQDESTGEMFHGLVHEWWRAPLASQTSLGLTRFFDRHMPEYMEALQAGQSFWQLIDQVPLPLRAPFEAASMQSMGIVPIFVGPLYSGLVAFDDCRKRRHWIEHDEGKQTLEVALRVQDACLLDGPTEDEPAIFRGAFPANTTAAFDRLCKDEAFATDCLHGEAALMWPGTREWHERHGREEALAFALKLGNRPLGLLTLAFARAGTLEDVLKQQVVRALANQFALAVQMQRLAGEAERIAVFEERTRIAGEVHDSLAQSFTSIALQSESVIAELDEHSPLRATLELIEDTARRGLAEARSSVLALRPLGDDPGALEYALEQLAERCTIAGSLRCRFRTSTSASEVGPDVRDAVLRVAQEAASNALRHSAASVLSIELEVRGGDARLSVIDDGKGIAAGAERGRGFGIEGMRARAAALGGTLTVSRTAATGGTSVVMIVPAHARPGALR